jgi:hypothetical protein
MVNDIIDGIVGAIKVAFPDVKIFTEQVKQGFAAPCFMIACANQAVSHSFDETYNCEFLFVVQYAPASATAVKEECNSVAMELYECLELIDVNGRPTRGTRMGETFSGGLLTLSVNYNLLCRRPREVADGMAELEHITGVGI